MPLRILIVARWYPSHEVPGRGSFVGDQAAALRDAGADVAVICPDPVYAEGLDGPAGPERRARLSRLDGWAATIGSRLEFARPSGRGAPGVPVLRIPAPMPAGGTASRDPLTLARLEAGVLVPVGVALHAVWPFDVIHAHTGLPDGLAAAALADALRLPVLTTEHDSAMPARLAEPAAVAAYRRLIGTSRALVAVSAALAQRIGERLGPDAGPIGVVPNVLPIDTFRTDQIQERDPNELLWVGARKESKGTDTLLRAFALVHQDRPSLRLRLIGRPASEADEQRLVALATELGITPDVRFEPPTDRAGVVAAMARAALFVHPSPWETFGIVAAEALAMGLPVAATPSSGVEEILGRDGRFGSIARDHDPASLGEAIRDALDRRAAFDPVLARAHVADRFAPGVVAGDLLARFAALSAVAGSDELRPDGPELPKHPMVDLPAVVVGFRRASAVARIPALPPALLAQLAVVTSAPLHPVSGQPTGEARPAVGLLDWADVDVGASFRARLAALGPVAPRSLWKWRSLLRPLRALRRRRLWSAQPRLFVEARQRAVGDAIARIGSSTPPQPVMLLPLDADDLESIEPFVADGRVFLAPGTLGWLVDRWASPAE